MYMKTLDMIHDGTYHRAPFVMLGSLNDPGIPSSPLKGNHLIAKQL